MYTHTSPRPNNDNALNDERLKVGTRVIGNGHYHQFIFKTKGEKGTITEVTDRTLTVTFDNLIEYSVPVAAPFHSHTWQRTAMSQFDIC